MCLDLLKFKCFSETIDPNEFYVENFVDINSTELAHLADEFTLTGKKLGEQLLKSAQESVKVDIEMVNTQLRVNSAAEQMRNKYGFTSGYDIGNKGIKVADISNSLYSSILIKSIVFKPNFSGEFDVLIDDGRDPVIKTITAQIGVINNFELDYKTKMKTVKIKAVNEDLEFYKLIKTDKSCGSCNKHKYHIIEQGIENDLLKDTNYKFIVGAYLVCDTSDLLCTAIQNTNVKLAVIKLMAYSIGIDYYTKMITSTRLNETTTGISPQDLQLFIDRLRSDYKRLLYGDNKTTYGFAKILESSLKSNNDWCVQCNASNYISKATF